MNRCANQNCNCSAADESAEKRFCSASCANAAEAHDLADAMCGCTHAACTQEVGQ